MCTASDRSERVSIVMICHFCIVDIVFDSQHAPEAVMERVLPEIREHLGSC